MKFVIFLIAFSAFLHNSLAQGVNCSSENKTDLFSSFRSKEYNYAIFGTLLLLNLIILIGNPATILVIIFKEKKPYDMLILGLAVFDTLTGVIPLPITNYNYYYYLFVNKTHVEESYFITGGEIGCTLYGWSALTFKSGSMLILAIIPFERLLAINFPFWYKKKVTLWKMGIVLLIAIIFSGLQSALPAIPYLSKMKPYGVQKSYCHFEYDDPSNKGSVAYSYFIQIYGYGLVLIASVCYTILICSIVLFLIRRRKYTARTGDVNRKKQRELLLSLKFLLIIIIFNFGWLPFLVSVTFRTIFPDCSPYENIHSILEFLGVRIAVLNSVINPIVYVLLMQSYRRGYRVLLGTCCFWATCRKYPSLKPNRDNRDEYLSKSLNQKSKELSKTISFHSEFRFRQRSLNNSRENVSLMRQESLLASPRYGDSACNSGKNSITSLQPADIGGIFHYIPGGRSDVVSYAIRELEEPSTMEAMTTMENIMPESISAYTLASESTLQNSTLPRDLNREDVVTPLSGGPWSYSFYINGQALDRSDQSIDKTSEYSGIPGYSYVDREKSAELKGLASNSLTRFLNKDSMEGDMSSKGSGSLDLEKLGIEQGVDVEMFANQSAEQQDRPSRISSTIPHSYKPHSMYPNGKEMYPKRKLRRTTAHELRTEVRTPPHLRILQYEARSHRRAVASRGVSNPLEPLREIKPASGRVNSFNIHNSNSVPLKLSDLHSLKLSQSNTQLNKASKASLSPLSSHLVLSPTNVSVNSGDTGYASSRVTASTVSKQPKFKRNNSLRQSFRDALGGFANNMKKRVSKSKSSIDFQLQTEDV